MKKKTVAFFVVALMLFAPPAMAQSTSFATQIGTKLLTSVVGALLGKGFTSIFESGPKPVTAVQLSAALAKSFKSEKLKDIEADIDNLRSKVRAYQKSGDTDARREQIDTITDLADHIRSTIQVRIHSDGQFFNLLPDYMTANSIWIAFKAERRWVAVAEDADAAKIATALKDADHIVAAEIVHIMGVLKDFYRYDLLDTGARKCIKKKASQHYYNAAGDNIPDQVGIFKSRKINVTKEYCAKEVWKYLSGGQVFQFSALLHTDFVKSYRLFKHPKHNQWFFTYASSIGRKRGEYTLEGPFTSENQAYLRRTELAIVFYGDIVGDVPGTVRHWRDIAAKIGLSHQGSEAKRLSKELGAG